MFGQLGRTCDSLWGGFKLFADIARHSVGDLLLLNVFLDDDGRLIIIHRSLLM